MNLDGAVKVIDTQWQKCLLIVEISGELFESNHHVHYAHPGLRVAPLQPRVGDIIDPDAVR